MRADTSNLRVVFLGHARFLRGEQGIEFRTRKMQALCVYLAAHAGASIDRKVLSGLLWSNFDENAARVSLRKAISLLCTDESTADLIGRDRAFVHFRGDPARIDLSIFLEAIASRTERGYRTALGLWRGEPLQGMELGEPAFDDWLQDFRSTTTAHIHRHLSKQLDDMAANAVAPQVEIALCELIVRIERADEDASDRLVRLYAGQGNIAATTRRFRAFDAALRDLELPVRDSLVNFAKSLRGVGAATEITPDLPNLPYNGIPTVALQRPSGMRPMPDLFAYAHSEVMCQLTRFHSMRCFEPLPVDDEQAEARQAIAPSRMVRLEDGADHDYRLLLWNEPNARALYLRCVNARRRNTVSCVRLSYEELADRQRSERIIATAINTIEQDILNDDGLHPDSPFSRWLAAYKQLQQFTPQSDSAALGILEELANDAQGSRLSLVHSSISSILMKRRMFLPGSIAIDDDQNRAEAYARRALQIDGHEPFNHVIMGWLKIQAKDHDAALGAFDDALSLNPFSSRTLIAAAEANAYCGQLENARLMAERAMELSGRHAPVYFHGYLATIAYLAGDLEECLRRLQRSPDNIHSLLLTVAAHQERADVTQVASARVRLERELRRTEPVRPFDRDALSRWVVTSNMTR